MKLRLVSFFLGLLAAGIIPGCKKENPVEPEATSKIRTGASVDVSTTMIPPSGGSIEVTTGVLAGFTLTIPDSAYDDTRTYHVSYAPIEGHDFGELFTPISPLITISNGTGYAANPMQLRIPCTVADDEFAMAFAFDPASGEMSALPLAASDSTQVTTVIGSFDLYGHAVSSGLPKGGAARQTGGTSIVVSKVKKTALLGTYQSGFVPGVDDWEFPNYGSITSTNGHCNGQSVTMLWYYREQKLKGGKQALYEAYDGYGTGTTSVVWQDNPKGYKLASIVQNDQFYGTKIFGDVISFFAQSVPFVSDYSTMMSVKYSIRLFREPQLLAIWSRFYNRGHAIVAYAASDNWIYVADPNFPGDATRQIHYTSGSFEPYSSGATTASTSRQYTHIYHMGTRALMAWNSLQDRWNQFENGTVGNGSFPTFTIKAWNDTDKFVPLYDGYTTKGSFDFTLISGQDLRVAKVFNADQVDLGSSSPIRLPAGTQYLGFYVVSAGYDWAGFQWFRITSTADSTRQLLPLAAGNRWDYDHFYLREDGTQEQVVPDSWTIGAGVTVGSETWYPLTTDNDVTTYHVNRVSGLYQAYSAVSPMTLLYRYPANIGDTSFTFRYSNLMQNYIVLDTAALVSVSIDGIIKDFQCYKYGLQMRNSSGTVLTTAELDALANQGTIVYVEYYFYYAPGVGRILEEGYKLASDNRHYQAERVRLKHYELH